MNLKILEKLEDNKYLVEIKPIENSDLQARIMSFGVAHDYAYFIGNVSPVNKNGSIYFGAEIEARVHIPIRHFVKTVLPRLISHKYTQPEHLADRFHTEDDTTWNSKYNLNKNLTGPRFKKGDPYPAYAYGTNEVIYFYENGQKMVSVLLKGEREPNIVTEQFFEKFVKDKLK